MSKITAAMQLTWMHGGQGWLLTSSSSPEAVNEVTNAITDFMHEIWEDNTYGRTMSEYRGSFCVRCKLLRSEEARNLNEFPYDQFLQQGSLLP